MLYGNFLNKQMKDWIDCLVAGTVTIKLPSFATAKGSNSLPDQIREVHNKYSLDAKLGNFPRHIIMNDRAVSYFLHTRL